MFIPVGDTSSREFPTPENDGPFLQAWNGDCDGSTKWGASSYQCHLALSRSDLAMEKLFGATNGEDMYHIILYIHMLF